MELIRNFKTSNDLFLFLEEKISILENKDLEDKLQELRKDGVDIIPKNLEIFNLEKRNREYQTQYLDTLELEERILLLTLFYIGDEIDRNNEEYKNEFYSLYEFYFTQYKSQSEFLNRQMTGKTDFIKNLYNAKEKYEDAFILR
ncbi:hypothetical protein [Cetobacterium somerae]